MHLYLSNTIFNLLDSIYYKNLQKIYNESLNIILKVPKISIIKPEYFIYANYYFLYLYLYYITNKNLIFYSFFLHITLVFELVFENIIEKYEYKPINKIDFLKNSHHLLFIYFTLFKIYFIKISSFKKIFIVSSKLLFYSLHNINIIYKERLKCIEDKNKIFDHYLKILIISPNKKIIGNIAKYTEFFSYSNLLFFINILLYFLI